MTTTASFTRTSTPLTPLGERLAALLRAETAVAIYATVIGPDETLVACLTDALVTVKRGEDASDALARAFMALDKRRMRLIGVLQLSNGAMPTCPPPVALAFRALGVAQHATVADALFDPCSFDASYQALLDDVNRSTAFDVRYE